MTLRLGTVLASSALPLAAEGLAPEGASALTCVEPVRGQLGETLDASAAALSRCKP